MEGEHSGLETREENVALVALGRGLKEQLTGSLCRVIPHTAGSIFLRQSTPLHMASTGGKAIALPIGITLPYPVVLKPDH